MKKNDQTYYKNLLIIFYHYATKGFDFVTNTRSMKVRTHPQVLFLIFREFESINFFFLLKPSEGSRFFDNFRKDRKWLICSNLVNLFNDQCSHHIETSQLICRRNQLTGFYMMETLVVKRLILKWNSATIPNEQGSISISTGIWLKSTMETVNYVQS